MLACNKPARKPDAGNPPVRFDEGEGPFIGPSLLYSSSWSTLEERSLVVLTITLFSHPKPLSTATFKDRVRGRLEDARNTLLHDDDFFFDPATLDTCP